MRIPYAIATVAVFFVLAQTSYSGVTNEDSGENVPPHWAFQRIERPIISNPLSANPIDSLLASNWEAKGIEPTHPALDDVLLRRLYLDLTGLPPSPSDREAFLDDPSPDKTTRLITRLLGSPRHAEHWGRHWMDIWRYTDWYGLGDQLRYSQKHIWHWRDWILESISSDKGYDQMVMEMLAGDELDPGNLDVARATGFLARNYFLFNRTTWLDSTIEHTSKAFLGLTINCAKCHDHKYDPVTQVDYYRLRAIFEPHQVRLDAIPGETNFEKDGIAMAFDNHPDAPTYLHTRGDEATPDETNVIAPDIPKFLGSLNISPVSLPADAWSPGLRDDIKQARLNAARQESPAAHAAMEARIAADNAQFRDDADEATTSQLAEEAAKLEWQAELERLHGTLTRAEQVAVDDATEKATKALDDARTNLEKLKKRGPAKDYTSVFGSRKALETPEHNFNTYGPTYPKTSTGRRLALANWMTSRDNPLTARVAVNHLWLRTMGQPLVADMTDFGHRAAVPLHRVVLDYLAVELMEHNWSLKHVLQLITTSQAYQRDSSKLSATSNTLSQDSENHYYWRANSKRMTSQMLRDVVQACGDSLDFQMGGPPIAHNTPSARRGIYLRHSRDDIHRFHVPFDDANILECYRREESIAPQQALALMNDKHVFMICRKLATINLNRSEFLRKSFVQVLGRRPSNDELAACHESIEELIASGSGEIEARTTIILALFNHNDFVTIR